jgi:hypothetical protein
MRIACDRCGKVRVLAQLPERAGISMWPRPFLIVTFWSALLIASPVFAMGIEVQGNQVVMAGTVIGNECSQL